MNLGLGAGTGSNVDGNHGNSNGLDLILFDGTLTNSLSWLTPTNMTSDHAFGYAILNGLTITSGNTLTLPAAAILKSFGTLTFQGATLDATAGGATITTIRDNTVGLQLCPSVFITTCGIPVAGDWGPLNFTQDFTTTLRGNGALVGTTIKFPQTAFSIFSGATSTVGSTGFGLLLSNVTITNASGDGIQAGSTPVSMSGGAITNFGSQGISFSSHNLTVNNVTISNPSTPNSSSEGITVSGISNRTVVITNNTIDGAGTYGISLSSPSNVTPGSLTLTGNTVKNSGLANPALSRQPHPALRLFSMNLGLGAGAGSNVDGNHGNSNGLDLILFDGTLTNSLSWLTPTNMTSDHAFGYAILNGLTITSGNTLTLPAGAILKSFGTLTFQGATLDATAGGATITTIRDNTVGLQLCPSVFITTCGTPVAGDWGSLSFTQDLTTTLRGNGALTGTTIKFPQTAFSIFSGATRTVGSTSFGLVLSNVTITNASGDGIQAGSTPVSMSGGAITNFGSQGISFSSHNLTVTGVTISNATLPSSSSEGITVSGISNRTVVITGKIGRAHV